MRSFWLVAVSAIALAFALPIAAQSSTTTLSYVRSGSAVGTATAGVQPSSEIEAGEFVNKQAATTSPPEGKFQNTAMSATDESGVVGDVATGGSYTGTTATLSAATTAGQSSNEDDSTSMSAATTTPILFAAAAACVVAIAAIAIVKKRADMKVSSPHTPPDKAIYI